MKTQIRSILDTLHAYPDLLVDWHYTDEHTITSLQQSNISFKVDAPNYRGRITITYDPATLYTIRLTDSAITFYGVRDEEHVLDVIKDFVENGEVYM